jgi:hypothetical protein
VYQRATDLTVSSLKQRWVSCKPLGHAEFTSKYNIFLAYALYEMGFTYRPGNGHLNALMIYMDMKNIEINGNVFIICLI